MTRFLCALATVFAFVSLSASAAAKTDIVIVVNGDSLTGEVKSLERGRLRFKTDATDTISIEWDDVAWLGVLGLVTNQLLAADAPGDGLGRPVDQQAEVLFTAAR